MRAILALEDGMIFQGRSFGADGESYGEVVFNTSMTGYQEILTDPSYKGQIVTMTYPLIGNYGVNPEDIESRHPWVEGFIVRELSVQRSNWRSSEDLSDFLKKYNIIGIEGIDTRALTKHLRDKGVKKGIISTTDLNPKRLVEKALASPGLIGRDLVKEVAIDKPYEFIPAHEVFSDLGPQPVTPRFHIVAFDCGMKTNILRMLTSRGCRVTVVPPTTTAAQVLAYQPDGIFLSNGPGDPEGVPYLFNELKLLLDKKPIFGICLGHQMLGLAFGGKTFKLKFGHRGANQPVKYIDTNRVEITSQNHGFAVDPESLKGSGLRITHINLNDQTNEGFEHEKLPVFSVQYHPEASPGPHDANYLFDKFIRLIEQHRK
ncbi:MAG: glutamine-hydrolyzing carbamoyl-phosphate synthase small subunit [bacterium]